ncbi:hypothetical protein GT370_15900 [Acidocella sp. MX-AZ03]|uniref:hypothetical protein n=1 Tax=Acidocella sp. MX-AZ03 TaxID=2697363 RepID=UPI0022DE1EB3|nr:hypothetical protein [Acidocella sp. MX-AZ03]WBO58624.1 hypothetical protein GT370_15900 [Acidocella sp. MX-AZ03]
MVFNVALALLLMQLGIYRVIQNILGLYANFAVGWMGALAADLVINKRLGLSPPGIEFKRAYLYDINPVGVGAMGLSVLVSTLMSFGVFGPVARAVAPFGGLIVAFVAAPAIAWATKGRFYLARPPEDVAAQSCIVCEGGLTGRTWPAARPMAGRSARSAVRWRRVAMISASRREGWRRA